MEVGLRVTTGHWSFRISLGKVPKEILCLFSYVWGFRDVTLGYTGSLSDSRYGWLSRGTMELGDLLGDKDICRAAGPEVWFPMRYDVVSCVLPL
jgi:hypothetical protein